MTDTVVVDANIAVKWLLPEELTEEALDLARGWAKANVVTIAPVLLWTEVSNVLHQRVRSGEIKTGDASLLMKELIRLGLEPRSEVHLSPKAIEMAAEYGLTNTYDAIYLALAEEEQAEFWTADRPLYQSARQQVEWVHFITGV